MSFSHFLSICLSVRCKLFTVLTSSERLGQFQPNLAESIIGWRGFKFVQMKDHTLLKGEIIWIVKNLMVSKFFSSKTIWSEKMKHVWKYSQVVPSSSGLWGSNFNYEYIEKNLLNSAQKLIGQKSCNFDGSIFRWCRYKFVQIMILRGKMGPQWKGGRVN